MSKMWRKNDEGDKMKIAISSMGNDIENEVDEKFGRCSYFIIFELKDKEVINQEIIKNAGKDIRGGAGISAAKKVAEQGVKVVISGNVGPRAIDVLCQFNIEVYRGSGKVKAVLQNYLENKLDKIEEKNANCNTN